MSITEFVESPGYKKAMGKVYGFGAAIVLAGALFKIMHYPGAELMLLIGMGTEIIIFGLSAFEPPHELPDWSLVYPELVGLEPRNSGGTGGGGGSELQALIQTGKIDNSTVDDLAKGIKKLSSTTSQLADLGNASMATESYMQSMQSAATSVEKLSNVQNKSAQQIQESSGKLSDTYLQTADNVNESAQKLVSNYTKSSDIIAETGQSMANNLSTSSQEFNAAISQSGKQFASDISSSSKALIDSMNQSGAQFVSSYASLSESLNEEIKGVSEKSKKYNAELNSVNSNLSAINSVFELQLKGSKAQVDATKQVTTGLQEITSQFNQSVSDAKLYKEGVAQLSQTVSELNTIYGNMLSAMNVGTK